MYLEYNALRGIPPQWLCHGHGPLVQFSAALDIVVVGGIAFPSAVYMHAYLYQLRNENKHIICYDNTLSVCKIYIPLPMGYQNTEIFMITQEVEIMKYDKP